MSDDPNGAGQELAEHLALLQRYLSDEVAPLVFSEALPGLLVQPPAVIAAEIRSWVAAQYRSASPLPVSDYLFHSVRKLHVVGELGLLPIDTPRPFLLALQQVLLERRDAGRDRGGDADRPVLRAPSVRALGGGGLAGPGLRSETRGPATALGCYAVIVGLSGRRNGRFS